MIETEDLFLAGFGLARGGQLAGVVVRGINGRRMAFFRITCPDVEQLQDEVYQGQALVNLRLLKAEVMRLKNLAFQALREEESKHAGEQGRAGADPLRQPARAGRR